MILFSCLLIVLYIVSAGGRGVYVSVYWPLRGLSDYFVYCTRLWHYFRQNTYSHVSLTMIGKEHEDI